MNNHGPCLGYMSIPLSASPSGFSISTTGFWGAERNVNAALVRVEVANARYRMDGTAANTATSGGMPMLTTDNPLWIEPSQGGMLNFSAVAQTGSPILQVLFFGVGQR